MPTLDPETASTLRGIGLLLVAAVLIMAAVSSAVLFVALLLHGGQVGPVEVGDCVNGQGEVADCSAPGTYKVVSVHPYPGPDDDYPEFELEEDHGGCLPWVERYFFPTRESWDRGHRLILCVR